NMRGDGVTVTPMISQRLRGRRFGRSRTTRQLSRGGRPALLLPLTMLDESLLITQETRAAWNVQFEVAADHRVDADRLRQAVRSCCQRHPMARARLAPAHTGGSSYQWCIADDVDRDPLRVVDCPDATALEALRAELYTPYIALDASPGFRVALARRPGGEIGR